MARRSLKPQLNQIRTWVRQGRTDAWIAHQLEVSVKDVTNFKSEHDLEAGETEGVETDSGEEGKSRRRRGRRGGRGRKRGGAKKGLEGTFDHGEDGYGLWLDPAIQDDALYAEHWAGHRPVKVTVEADRIIIERLNASPDDA